MGKAHEKLEKIREFLSKSPAEFVLVYHGKVTDAGLELKWCAAVSRGKKTREDYEMLASIYQEIAQHSFRNKQSIILKETPSRPESQSVRWCGLDIHKAPYHGPIPTNSMGQSWWDFVVEPADNRHEGYVIVSRVAAREEKEVEDYLRKTYQMLCD